MGDGFRLSSALSLNVGDETVARRMTTGSRCYASRMRPIHLFYSWQSDHDRKVCANFIKIALEQAIEKLRDNAQIDIHLGSDTAGVPGTPPVNETIPRKIKECDILVGDVTFVGQTERGQPKCRDT